MGEVNPAANAAQAQRWNGASGQYWIEHRERHLAEHQNLTPHLFRSAAIVPGEKVLDVGCGCGDTTIIAARRQAPRMGEAGQGRERGGPGPVGSDAGLRAAPGRAGGRGQRPVRAG